MNKFRICISTPQKRSEGDESYSSTEDDISRVRGAVKTKGANFLAVLLIQNQTHLKGET